MIERKSSTLGLIYRGGISLVTLFKIFSMDEFPSSNAPFRRVFRTPWFIVFFQNEQTQWLTKKILLLGLRLFIVREQPVQIFINENKKVFPDFFFFNSIKSNSIHK